MRGDLRGVHYTPPSDAPETRPLWVDHYRADDSHLAGRGDHTVAVVEVEIVGTDVRSSPGCH
jgi:hypothetical protein